MKQTLVKFLKNSSICQFISKYSDHTKKNISLNWYKTLYDEKVSSGWQELAVDFIVKRTMDESVDVPTDREVMMFSHLGASSIINSKSFLDTFIRKFNGCYRSTFYFQCTDYVFMQKNMRNSLWKTNSL